MACYKPLQAYQRADGEVVFVERGNITRSLLLPCNQCVGCRLERSRQWAMRCMHEASLHKKNCFLTLTYNDENLPAGPSLKYDDVQLFWKRLREWRYRAEGVREVRYYCCGEYGESTARPHYHACVFGFDFPDKMYFRKSGGDGKLFTSALLSRLWPVGMSSIGEVTFESAAYVARYMMKKVTGDAAALHYRVVDAGTGEIVDRVPEFAHMSQSIGRDWLRLYWQDLQDGKTVVRGRKVNAPRAYLRRMKKLQVFEEIEYERHKGAVSAFADNTDSRLATKEKVALARVNLFKRSVE